ncbi:MAG: hypothetical protein SFV17_10260 [Candidatus Obscuribacter sp.]|nr:hypothetical protein [Candidatus Obscuribacter sp.]
MSEENVEPTFVLARAGYSQVMSSISHLPGDEPFPPTLTMRMRIVKESLQECTALQQGLFKMRAFMPVPKATEQLGLLAALCKEYFDLQWQSRVANPKPSSQVDVDSHELHRELAEARIRQCLEEVLAVAKSDAQASLRVKNCLGILSELMQLHCMSGGLALAEDHADYRELFLRQYYPRMLDFPMRMVSFVLSLLHRADQVLPKAE